MRVVYRAEGETRDEIGCGWMDGPAEMNGTLAYLEETLEVDTASVQRPVQMIYSVFHRIIFRDEIDEPIRVRTKDQQNNTNKPTRKRKQMSTNWL